MTETTRNRITIAAKIGRAVVLTLTLVVLAAAAVLALGFYLLPWSGAQQAKAECVLDKSWTAIVVTARALATW